jgi:uncharacterized protein (TIGR03435 family)
VTPASAQTKTPVDAEPRFDVASVKLILPNERRFARTDLSWGGGSGRVVQLAMPLHWFISEAYDLRGEPKRLVGPDWMATASYDIRANAPAGTPKARILLMMRSLLKDRFQMKIHKETKVESGYALVVRKGGPKLRAAAPGRLQNDASKPGKASAPSASWGVIDGPYGRVRSTTKDHASHTEFESVTMPSLAKYLGQLGMFDTTFVDRTGLAGSYQVWLDATTRELIGAGPVPYALKETIDIPDPAGRSVMESLHQQGLDVVKQKLPIEKFVIDHIERVPTLD